ncbi:hypothetical protein [Marinicellulosiphila megalodicopiae]|uniref:hypothetical protein n=1 Tax=Marinicellulosiphila megalodicopiae TaxID=2724896 RepID=UPI003BB0ED13
MKVNPFGKVILPCPVCAMSVDKESVLHTYLVVDYYFCSRQCLLRFKSHPGLYCGNPKSGKSVKQRGVEEIKKRKITLSISMLDDQIQTLNDSIKKLMGIKEVTIYDKEILVTYDLIVISLEEIEHAIEANLSINTSTTNTLKRKWIHYTESCELDNLANPVSKGCCH